MLSFVESLKQIIADVQATGGAVVERSLPSPDLLQRLREYAVQQIATTERAEYHLLEWFTEGFFDEYVRVCVIHLRKLGIMDDEIVYRLITKVIDSSLSGKYPSPSKAQDFDKRLVVSVIEIWDQMGDEQTVAYTFSQERWLIAWDYQKSQWKVTGLGRLLLELSPVQAAIFLLSIDTFFSTGEHDFRHVSADVLRNILHPQTDSEEIPRFMPLHRDILTRLGILREPDDYHPDRIQFTPVGRTVLDRVLSKDNPFRDAARTLIETEELGDTFKGSSLEIKDVLHIVNHSDSLDNTNLESIATSVQSIEKNTALDTIQIFLSYAREDEGKVEKLYQKLSDAGFKPWMDKRDIFPGEQWKSRIPQAIRRSDFFLACLSANSVSKRGFIQREIRDALDIWQEKLDSDIYLIPVRLEDCEVPESLRDFQWVSLFEENGWTRLVKAIQEGMKRRGVLDDEKPSPGTDMPIPREDPKRIQYWIDNLIEGKKAEISARKLRDIAIRDGDEAAMDGLWDAAQRTKKPALVIAHCAYSLGRIMIKTSDPTLEERGFEILNESTKNESERIVDNLAYTAGEIALQANEERTRKRARDFIESKSSSRVNLVREKYAYTEERVNQLLSETPDSGS